LTITDNLPGAVNATAERALLVLKTQSFEDTKE
jgi:hypothetical protein